MADSDNGIVNLSDADAEIAYLTQLTCERCESPVRVQRRGARPIESGDELYLMGFWDVRCTRCLCSKEIVTAIVV
jgi:hypothetical protein